MRLISVIAIAAVLVGSLSGLPCLAQAPEERVDREAIKKIKEEGLERSKVMETIGFLTDVHGPRLTGSPQTKAAAEWTKTRLAEWGLVNARLEPWGPFGRGWSLEGFTANMVKPTFAPLIAYPKAWSGSTPKAIRGTPIYLEAANEKELDQYRGKLHRAIVLMSPPREVKAIFEPLAQRQSDATLLALANGDSSALRGRRGLPPGTAPPSTVPSSAPGASPPATSGSPSPMPPGAAAPGGPPAPSNTFNATPEQRAAFALQGRKLAMLAEEGAGVILEPGRGDGGNLLVSAASLPRGQARGDGRPEQRNDENEPSRRFSSRGPSPWAADSPPVVPQAVVAVEHYNRLIRMLKKGSPVELEIDIAAQYHTDDLMSYNIVAEIPGSDLADEVVMLGGHFDSWHSGTGATDNAVGCGVALEAVRILQATGLKPRRTIRIALWTGEEQGLLGSKAYVGEHFGRASTPPSSGGRSAGPERQSSANEPAPAAGETAPPPQRPRTKYELKPEHARLSGYFNLDNGTGKIRGVYLQGNEAMRPIFRAWLAPFAELGAATIAQTNTGGTDHLSFDAVGLPGFQFIQDQMEYDTRTHHYSMDVYDRVQEEDMKQASIIMASWVYHAAMRDEKLPRKPLVGDVVQAGATESTKPADAAAPGETPKPAEPAKSPTVPN
ncbi:MAG: M20/M25/M40 family metallo-hydrolase [Planctomycetaceae bacterium]|nr:M20/M25/M40 family metallo-hydrolase [Planctomycetaceae bacterium]